jgi:hypothetical protein
MSSAAIAQEQTYDYQGNAMTGNAVETYTASLTFFGPVTNPVTPLNWSIDVTGNAFNTDLTCTGCEAGIPVGNTEPTSFVINATDGVLTSADIELRLYGGIPMISEDIGAKGDSLTLSTYGGVPYLSVSNDTPGTWKEVGGNPTAGPELDPSDAWGALALLGGFVLIVKARRPIEGV